MNYTVFLSLYVALLSWGASFLTSTQSFVVAISTGMVVFSYVRYLDVHRKKKQWEEFSEVLPPALFVGAQSTRELLSRISSLWVDREQMSMVLSEIREGVVAIDPNKHVILANERAKTILGISEGLSGDILETHTLPVEVNTAALESIKGNAYEGTWKEGKTPNQRYYEVVGLPISGQGALMVLRDITKIRRLERVRRDFIANISHELRTPITIVRANAETLVNGAMDDPEFGPRFLAAILRNGERLSRLINDLLDLSRIEAGQYTISVRKCFLIPIVNRVIETLKEEYRARGQNIIVEIPSESWAFIDEQAFEHIFTNYFENAIKYTQEGSTIVVRIREEDHSAILEVQDNGPGITAKHRPRIFERFYRVDKGRSKDAGGTGLGLSIVRHLAEAMGGEVGMNVVDKGTGSVFWCRMSKQPVSTTNESYLA
jgi:two-component system, OmpR family, phosphate regulon sensor histidine kinase PhoR